MSQPPAYVVTILFQQEETNAVAGRSTVRTSAIDVEFANIASSIVAIRANLALLQRDDGALHDGIVTPESLSAAVLALMGAALTAAGVPFVPAGAIAATNVQAALEELDAEKAPLVHTHVQSSITGLVADLAAIVASIALKAPLASPALTGTPTAPTAAPGNNSGLISNTAFVTAAIAAALTGGAVSAFWTAILALTNQARSLESLMGFVSSESMGGTGVPIATNDHAFPDPNDNFIYFIDANGTLTISGAVAPASAIGPTFKVLANNNSVTTGWPMIVLNQSTLSVAANRFFLPSGNVTLAPGESLVLWYDPTMARWRMLRAEQQRYLMSGSSASLQFGSGFSTDVADNLNTVAQATVIRASTGDLGGADLNGLAANAASANFIRLLFNTGTENIRLLHDSGPGGGAGGFLLPGNATKILLPNEGTTIFYDGGVSRWRTLS